MRTLKILYPPSFFIGLSVLVVLIAILSPSWVGAAILGMVIGLGHRPLFGWMFNPNEWR